MSCNPKLVWSISVGAHKWVFHWSCARHHLVSKVQPSGVHEWDKCLHLQVWDGGKYHSQ